MAAPKVTKVGGTSADKKVVANDSNRPANLPEPQHKARPTGNHPFPSRVQPRRSSN